MAPPAVSVVCQRQRDHHGETPARGVLRPQGSAHALGEPLRQRQSEAEPCRVVEVSQALERREHLVALVAPARRRRGRSPASAPGRGPVWSRRRPACRVGAWRTAFASTLTSTRWSSTGSASSGGRSGSSARSTSDGPRPSSSSDPTTTAAASTSSNDTASTPAWTRLTSSRSVTSVERVARLSSAVSRSSRRSASERFWPAARRPPIAATAAASGRRRSWLTAESSAVRT